MAAKKTLIILIAIAFALLVVVFLLFKGKSGFWSGKLVFFSDAPTVSDVVGSSQITYHDALNLLLDEAVAAKRIDKNTKENFLREAATVLLNTKITRAEFANLAVRIFQLQQYGYGATLVDINQNTPYSKEIYLFASNGGTDMQFKPSNLATRVFAQKAAQNLAQRFVK